VGERKGEGRNLKGVSIMNREEIVLTVNRVKYRIEIEPWRTLVEVLRETLGLTGTKKSCNEGECGACTVLMDGKPVASCLVLAIDAQGKEILTIEGLAEGERLHPIQEAFLKHGGIQCGFCTPGMVMSVKALLDEIPRPTPAEARRAISGNLCRCTGYQQIVDSIIAASKRMAPVRGDERDRCWDGKNRFKKE
jgi:aerobic-type carbon monoxide dehydrogenase small subunit (CoxS/CutS family)